MIAIEKFLLLKTVPLFMHVPDEILLELASSVAKEKHMLANQVVIEQDGTNENMYIIVSGKVKVHFGETVITELSEREIFGELSALTEYPPVTSVTTLTECLFLLIPSHELYELMNFESGLSKGLIQALCERAQNMSLQLQALHAKYENSRP